MKEEKIPVFRNFGSERLVVDLDKSSGAARWAEVIAAERSTAEALFASAWKEISPAAQLFSDWFGAAYRDYDGPYRSELRAWASAVNRDFGEVAMVNCAYDLEQVRTTLSFGEIGTTILQKLFGCSTAIAQLGDGEMIHIRNLDWPIGGMGPATRVFEFRKAGSHFYVVGFPMFIGALSGMRPGAYSATINWAPAVQLPTFDHSPIFLLREVFETCETYDEAVKRLKSARLSTSVFFTVCGVQPGQGCVIERTPDRSWIRPYVDQPIVQTNHHDDAGEFAGNNAKLDELEDDYLVKTTRGRREALTANLSALAGKTQVASDAVFPLLDGKEITNWQTCQRMVFRPRSGTYALQSSV